MSLNYKNKATAMDKLYSILWLFVEDSMNLFCQPINTLYAVGRATDPFGGDDNEQVNPNDSGHNYAS